MLIGAEIGILVMFNTDIYGQIVFPDWLLKPQTSVAVTEDGWATGVNPAALGIKNGEFFFLSADIKQNGTYNGVGWGFGFKLDGLGMIWETNTEPLNSFRDSLWYGGDLPENRSRYGIGLGWGGRGHYFGLAYHNSKKFGLEASWDVGYLYRPFRFLSLGLVAKGVNEPHFRGKKINTQWETGIALRPMGLFYPPKRGWDDRLTLFTDATFRRTYVSHNSSYENYFDKVDWKIGLIAQALPGLYLHATHSPKLAGELSHPAQWWGGLTFHFGRGELTTWRGEQHKPSGSSQLTSRGPIQVQFQSRPKPSKLKPKKPTLIEMKLEGPIVERQHYEFFFPKKERTIYKFYKDLEKLGEDPEVKGVVIKLGDLETGWAKLQEMRRALEKFKAKGKAIYVFMEEGGNGEYYLASVADRIYMPPTSFLDLTGLKAQAFFVRKTLDKLGIDPQLEHIGDYKSASDMFTREDMSEAQREATEAILDDIYSDFVKSIAQGRGKSEEEMRAIIDEGPFNADQALAKGLVDSLIYEDQFMERVKGSGRGKVGIVKESRYLKSDPYPVLWDDSRMKTIAIVYGIGGITTGESSEGGLFSGETMGSATITRALREAREDKSVKAVIFRIDSPGGSGLASELILREVKRYREGDKKKPIIVSMSDVAGSGGYYIACQADTIIAMSGTITGSIGVITGKFAYGGTYRKLGINVVTLKRGKFADMWSSSRSFTEEELVKLRQDLNWFYRIFLERVAEGRGMDTAQVNRIAQGRIWSGKAAKENGLVDINGGLDLAMEIAAQLAGVKEGEIYRVKFYPKRRMPWGITEELMGETMAKLFTPTFIKGLKLAKEVEEFEGEEFLMLMPYRLEIN